MKKFCECRIIGFDQVVLEKKLNVNFVNDLKIFRYYLLLEIDVMIYLKTNVEFHSARDVFCQVRLRFRN